MGGCSNLRFVYIFILYLPKYGIEELKFTHILVMVQCKKNLNKMETKHMNCPHDRCH